MWPGFNFRTPFLTVIYLFACLVNCWLTSGHISDSSASRNTSRHLGSPSAQPFIQARRGYTASKLKAMRKVQPKQHLCKDLWQKLGDLRVRKKFRSKRGGNKRAARCHQLPLMLRHDTKVDELDSGFRHNRCDIVSVTATWLTSDIPVSAVSLQDYVVVELRCLFQALLTAKGSLKLNLRIL